MENPEVTPVENTETLPVESIDSAIEPEAIAPEGRKSRATWIVIAVIAVALLAGAAFLGARLVNQQVGGGPVLGPDEGPLGGKQMIAIEGAGGGGPMLSKGGPGGKAVQIQIDPADEVPQRKPQASGMLQEIKDRSLFVGLNGNMMVTINEKGEVHTNSDDQGPAQEVVVTADTQIYRDATFDEQEPNESGTVKQVVEAFEFSQMEKNAMVTVWGQKRGDRIIAEVILYHQPLQIERAK